VRKTGRFYEKAGFSSVQTNAFRRSASRAAVDAVAPIVAAPPPFSFAGGDQADYVQWKARS